MDIFSYIGGCGPDELIDSVLFEVDDFQPDNEPGDLSIYYYGASANPRVTYAFESSSGPVSITASHYKIDWWRPNGTSSTGSRSKNLGSFKYNTGTTETPNVYDIMPQDARRDCNILTGTPWFFPDQRHVYPLYWNQGEADNLRSGLLTLNLKIEKNITTPATLLDGSNNKYSREITVNDGVLLTLAATKTFTMLNYNSLDHAATLRLKAKPTISLPGGTMLMEANSELIIGKYSTLHLELGSVITQRPGAKITVKRGGRLCNFGGKIQGSGSVVFEGPVTFCTGSPSTSIFFEDSTKIVLKDSAEWVLPDSVTVELKGYETALICEPGSKIKFGKGSKIKFENGARISADSCIFTSSDSSKTWDGMYIVNAAHDTIKNCVIENAYNGINLIQNPSLSFTQYSTQITNCVFNNTTDSTLLNAIYADGTNDNLIMGNTISCSDSGDFAFGIIAEYCGAGELIICDNNISDVVSGITLIQSSPYVARNVITGYTGATGSGIFLDNTNGTLEYNRVYNFNKSVELQYSAPYMLQNTFSNAYEINVGLKTSSNPVMRPVVSGSDLLWLGGNNTLSGSPTLVGINFDDECTPVMDSGYNYINTSSTYSVEAELVADIYATLNYWNVDDNYITGGYTFHNKPEWDGTTLPSIDGSDLNSIGFGLYDTVFITSIGDNFSAQDVFLEAYYEEMNGDYADAIALYKDVTEDYKSSEYSSVSLSRIFNCLEKMNANTSDYQSIQTYYGTIKTDTTYTVSARELSEDFVIKAKVKRGLVEDAISDYTTIYSQNLSNAKGYHALINKLSLESGYGSGDNQNGANLTGYKMALLSLLSGRDIQNANMNTSVVPSKFRLHQNYPNPFNPVTTIKYDVPVSSMVTLKIYDLLGREIFSKNEYRAAGTHEIKFDGSSYASGMYFYQLEAGTYKETKKMVLVK